MDSEMPYFLIFVTMHRVPGASFGIQYCISLSCLLLFLSNPYIPFLIYKIFHLLIHYQYILSEWAGFPCLVLCTILYKPLCMIVLCLIICEGTSSNSLVEVIIKCLASGLNKQFHSKIDPVILPWVQKP